MQSLALSPIPCKAARFFQQVRRHVFCRYYDSCLDYAVEKNWSGFSCEECKSYEYLPGDVAQCDDEYTLCIPNLPETELT